MEIGNFFNVTFFMFSDFPSPQKFQPPPASNPSTGSEHRLVHNEGYKYKLCVQCQFNKIKTKKGWRVYTHFKCEKCNVPLCKNQGSQKRNCFVVYHQTELGDNKSVSVNTLTLPVSVNTPPLPVSVKSLPLPLVAPSDPSNSWSFNTNRSPEANVISINRTPQSYMYMAQSKQRFPPYPFQHPPDTSS